MKYAMLVYGDQSAWAELDEEEAARLRAESMPRWLALFEEIGKADPGVEGRELAAAAEAKVVRVVDGERSSPTARSPRRRSRSAGSSSPTLPDLDEAIRIAALVPAAENGSLEIRP